jgi:hypothetical protein
MDEDRIVAANTMEGANEIVYAALEPDRINVRYANAGIGPRANRGCGSAGWQKRRGIEGQPLTIRTVGQ